MNNRILLASELYAISQGMKCEGQLECHWCSAPCIKMWLHDDPGPQRFSRIPHYAKRLGSPFICIGCHLFRRKRVTVPFLDGGNTELRLKGYKDGECPMYYSWLITAKGAWAIRNTQSTKLYQYLLKPDKQFCLMLVEDYKENTLHQAVTNDKDEITASTVLQFTFNGIVMNYSVHELETVLKDGKTDGREPGVRKLIELFGDYPVLRNQQNGVEDKDRGRPKKEGEPIGTKMNKQVSR